MKRPYYVHTPRNIYGESLVHQANTVCYEIMATHTGSTVHDTSRDWEEAKLIAKRLNDAHETEMAYAMHI